MPWTYYEATLKRPDNLDTPYPMLRYRRIAVDARRNVRCSSLKELLHRMNGRFRIGGSWSHDSGTPWFEARTALFEAHLFPYETDDEVFKKRDGIVLSHMPLNLNCVTSQNDGRTVFVIRTEDDGNVRLGAKFRFNESSIDFTEIDVE